MNGKKKLKTNFLILISLYIFFVFRCSFCMILKISFISLTTHSIKRDFLILICIANVICYFCLFFSYLSPTNFSFFHVKKNFILLYNKFSVQNNFNNWILTWVLTEKLFFLQFFLVFFFVQNEYWNCIKILTWSPINFQFHVGELLVSKFIMFVELSKKNKNTKLSNMMVGIRTL